MNIEMLPTVDNGCGCAECRAERGDTQFAEFMQRFNEFAARRRIEALKSVVEAATDAFAGLTDVCASLAVSFEQLRAAIPEES